MNDQTREQATMNADALYREEVITDRKVGTIRVLKPVTRDGEADNSRPTVYVGQASLYTPGGALPLNFDLEANNLAEAVAAFPEAAEKAVEETMQKLQEMRRESASQLYVPGQGGATPGKPGGGFELP